MALAPIIVVLYVVDFSGHDYWATALFAVAMATDWFDGRIARRSGRTSAMGSLLDPVADKVLVLAVLIVLVDRGGLPRLDGRRDRGTGVPRRGSSPRGARARCRPERP